MQEMFLEGERENESFFFVFNCSPGRKSNLRNFYVVHSEGPAEIFVQSRSGFQETKIVGGGKKLVKIM